MSHLHILSALALAGALFAPGSNAGAAPVSPGPSRIAQLSAVEFAQDRPKSETVKQKVKRIWRNAHLSRSWSSFANKS